MIRSFADLTDVLIEPSDFKDYYNDNDNKSKNNNKNNNNSNDDDNYSEVDYDYDDFEKDNDSISRIHIKKDNIYSASKRYVNNNDSNISNDSNEDVFININKKNDHVIVAELEEWVDDNVDDDINSNVNITNENDRNINRELFVKNSIDVIAIDGNSTTMNIVTNNDNNNNDNNVLLKNKTKIATNNTNNINTDWINKVISNIDNKTTTVTNSITTNNVNANTDKHKDVYIVKAQNRKYYYSKVEPVDMKIGSSIIQKAEDKSKTSSNNNNDNNSKNATNSIDNSIRDILNNGDVSQEDLVRVVKSLLEKAIVETNKKEKTKRMENLAVRIPSAPLGGVSKYDYKAMQWGQERVLGVLDVDPDYSEAIKLKEFHQLDDNYNNSSNDSDDIKVSTKSNNKKEASLPSSSLRKPTTAVRTGYNDTDENNEVDVIFNTIRRKEQEARLLKLGLSYNQVSDKAETVYASFLSDLISLCKRRSQLASSVEEMAMHRTIADEIKKAFASKEQIEIIRSSMVENAIEVNLNRRI